MKLADVKVGGEYLTKVGDRLERVTVLRTEQHTVYGRLAPSGKQMTYFRVQTAAGRVLPRARSAAALRPLEATS